MQKTLGMTLFILITLGLCYSCTFHFGNNTETGPGADSTNREVNLAFLQSSIWPNAGYPGGIPEVDWPVVDVTTRVSWGGVSTANTDALQTLIDGLAEPTVLYFPAGTYLLAAGIDLPSGVVLRGAGSAQTTLEFSGDGTCITVSGWTGGEHVPVREGLNIGSTQITLSDASNFSPGQGVELIQDDIVWDPEHNADWGRNSVGQVSRITAVSGNTLTITPPLNLNYLATHNPRARPLNLVTDVGLEYFYLKRNAGVDGNNINFNRAANCWVRAIDSDNTTKYHIGASSVCNVEIRDSYFHHAYSHGDGGQGYGLSLAWFATAVLAENNIFYDLRHAMMVQLGANANVFGYNYAERIFSDDGWAKSSISMHGHFPFMNLFEGNITSWVMFGDYWGDIGPGNTCFRNRILGSDRHEDFGDYEGIGIHYYYGNQFIIGNEVGGIGVYYVDDNWDKVPDMPAYIVSHGNKVDGSVTWHADYSNSLPDSYYLAGKPAFFGALAFPQLGGDLAGGGTIPALARFRVDGTTSDNVPQP